MNKLSIASSNSTNQKYKSANTTSKNYHTKIYNIANSLTSDEIPSFINDLVQQSQSLLKSNDYNNAMLCLINASSLLKSLEQHKTTYDGGFKILFVSKGTLLTKRLMQIDNCITHFKISIAEAKTLLLSKKKGGNLKYLKYITKSKIQLCTFLSQIDNHEAAFLSAKKGVTHSHILIQKIYTICSLLKQRSIGNYHKAAKSTIIMSTASSILPILEELIKRLVPNKESSRLDIGYNKAATKAGNVDMRALFGYLNENLSIAQYSITTISTLTPLDIKDIYSDNDEEIELIREYIIESIVLIVMAYFCMAVELRFLSGSDNNKEINKTKDQCKIEGEYWHAKSIEIAFTFLPSQYPLSLHIYANYNKHYSPFTNPIVCSINSLKKIEIIKPLKGAKQGPIQPIIHSMKDVNMTLTPYNEEDMEIYHSIQKDNESSRRTIQSSHLGLSDIKRSRTKQGRTSSFFTRHNPTSKPCAPSSSNSRNMQPYISRHNSINYSSSNIACLSRIYNIAPYSTIEGFRRKVAKKEKRPSSIKLIVINNN